jgi:hypothetical protein
LASDELCAALLFLRPLLMNCRITNEENLDSHFTAPLLSVGLSDRSKDVLSESGWSVAVGRTKASHFVISASFLRQLNIPR